MKYNFEEVIDRGGEYSAKYDELEMKFGSKELIPLWIADMDLPVADEIIEAMKTRLEKKVFGYTTRPDFYNHAIVDWFKSRHNYEVCQSSLIFSPGVIPSISLILQQMTSEGDNIIIQQPVYSPFESVIKNNNLEVKINPLIIDEGDYVMDYEHLESIIDTNTKFLILCNPHNPVGRVWRKDELLRIAEICLRHGVMIISDEIHCDLIFKGHRHIPIASLSKEVEDITITCVAPSKTFNIPGLQASIIITTNPKIYSIIEQAFTTIDIKRNNCFSLVATHAGYAHGHDWLDEVMAYIEGNADFVINYVNKHIPKLKIRKPEGTYLLWIDCTELELEDEALKSFMIDDAKLALGSGSDYGLGGSGYQRINIACSRKVLEKALEQLKVAVKKLNI